ncbi:hypothetical protein [Streptomyces albofaciens]|uniref:hypothetical protein n=1 Tax=Streptomyces albofaciens TaxID=66866 RepID=UPI001FCA7106|nr:hypothetical protein [Streptomyces albofaciens]
MTAVAGRLGSTLTREEAKTAMHWAENHAYRTDQAVIPDEHFALYLAGLRAKVPHEERHPRQRRT